MYTSRSYRNSVDKEALRKKEQLQKASRLMLRKPGVLEEAVLHLGPTNSGKTHAGVTDLIQHGQGVFASPLRMLAKETYDKLSRLDANVGLVTGEEVINPHADILCVTAESAPLRRPHGVLVLDETHWMGDAKRGTAWTRLLVSGEYQKMHIIGDQALESIVPQLVADAQQLTVLHHKRLASLTWVGTVDASSLQSSTAVVAFSKKAVLAVARHLTEQGLDPVVLYGALPHNTRRNQIEQFTQNPHRPLVTTDVIGHGVNLPISTVLFAETEKYDGTVRRALKPWEAGQISGRAGRWGLAEEGKVGVFGPLPWLNCDSDLVENSVHVATGEQPSGLVFKAAKLAPRYEEMPARTMLEWNHMPEVWKGVVKEQKNTLPIIGVTPVELNEKLRRIKHLSGALKYLGPQTCWVLAHTAAQDPYLCIDVARELINIVKPHDAVVSDRKSTRNPAKTMSSSLSLSTGLDADALKAALFGTPVAEKTAPPSLLCVAVENAEKAVAVAGLKKLEEHALRMRDISCLLSSTHLQEVVTKHNIVWPELKRITAVENALAERIESLLANAVVTNTHGVCRKCKNSCAPWMTMCLVCKPQ